MRVKRIIETAIYTNKLEETEKFYIEILGLELSSRKEGRHSFLRCDNSAFLLFDPEVSSTKVGTAPLHGAVGQCHVAFEIDESVFDSWQDFLKSKKIEIETIVDWEGGGKSIYFRDPGQNSVELTTKKTWGFK